MQHFRGNNINVTTFPGLCEEVDGHSHPVFLFFFYDKEEEGFWLIVVVNTSKGHEHEYIISEEDVETFLEKKELIIVSSKDENHQHKLYFHADDMQTEIIDPFEEIDLEDIEEDDDDEEDD